MNPRTVRTLFRTVAIAEALSWAGLLIGMFFKYVVQDDPHASPEGGVPVLGLVHGAMFVLYLVTAVVAWRTFGWSWKVATLALLAAIPPFCTVVFEKLAERRGLLAVRPPAASPAG